MWVKQPVSLTDKDNVIAKYEINSLLFVIDRWMNEFKCYMISLNVIVL